MSRIAIISALHDELSAVLQQLPDEEKTVVAGREFWQGHLHGHAVVAVLSRIGKVAAATTATVLVERFGVQRMVFTGVAGGLGAGVRVGDLVVAQEFVQHDMDASPLFPRHEVPLYGITRFATDAALSNALAQAANQVLAQSATTLGPAVVAQYSLHAAQSHRGLIASGDRFINSQADSLALRQALPDVLAVEMEGAAVAQVCHDYGIAFAAIRTISDRADDSAHVDFAQFTTDVAARYGAAVVERLLRLL
jgi:adenosylhomocysteine nucleosidase